MLEGWAGAELGRPSGGPPAHRRPLRGFDEDDRAREGREEEEDKTCLAMKIRTCEGEVFCGCDLFCFVFFLFIY